MNYTRIVQNILNVGEAMLCTGAENFRIDDSLYRMCRAYGFVRYDVFVIPSNIQITVETPEGEIITQIRHVESTSFHYEQLDRLNALSRYVCANRPDEEEFYRRFCEIMDLPAHPAWLSYLAAAMGVVGFGVICGCDWKDCAVAAFVSLIISFIGSWLNRKKVTLLIYNILLSFIAEALILGAVHAGLGTHSECIMISIVFLLISGLGVSTGIREMIQRDFISGTLNIMNSLLGAAGISMGIAFAILLWGNATAAGIYHSGNDLLQIVFSFIACIGFAILFNVKGKKIFYVSLGGMLTQTVYLLAFHLYPVVFVAVLAAATFTGAYAFVMSRVLKAVSTMFLSISVFPLIPGASLYYLMYGIVTRNADMAQIYMEQLMIVCLAIALGYILMDIIGAAFYWLQKKEHYFDLKKTKRS